MTDSSKTIQKHLAKFAWVSIGTAVITILLKVIAYFLTNSVGLLSDALESVINLITAIITLIAIKIAANPPDNNHTFGHSKAEYFSSGAEGTLILGAAIIIIITSTQRLISPQPLEKIDIGVLVSGSAALLNFFAARYLITGGKQLRSVALEANGRHLMTDVWTSIGVVVGVSTAAFTNWHIIDPIIAIVVAVRIIYSGWVLVSGAISGLMDIALPKEEVDLITQILEQHMRQDVTYHALRTRQAGRQRFVTVHIQVPGAWDVQRGHILLEEIEADIRTALAPISVVTHLEPLEDPVSWHDIALIRED